jgi:hypothetical protein
MAARIFILPITASSTASSTATSTMDETESFARPRSPQLPFAEMAQAPCPHPSYPTRDDDNTLGELFSVVYICFLFYRQTPTD